LIVRFYKVLGQHECVLLREETESLRDSPINQRSFSAFLQQRGNSMILELDTFIDMDCWHRGLNTSKVSIQLDSIEGLNTSKVDRFQLIIEYFGFRLSPVNNIVN
jgi:hypothetical protein